MSSILDALKKAEGEPVEGHVDLAEEVDAEAAENEVIAEDTDVPKVTVRLSPMMIGAGVLTLVVVGCVVAALATLLARNKQGEVLPVETGRIIATAPVETSAPAVPAPLAEALAPVSESPAVEPQEPDLPIEAAEPALAPPVEPEPAAVPEATVEAAPPVAPPPVEVPALAPAPPAVEPQEPEPPVEAVAPPPAPPVEPETPVAPPPVEAPAPVEQVPVPPVTPAEPAKPAVPATAVDTGVVTEDLKPIPPAAPQPEPVQREQGQASSSPVPTAVPAQPPVTSQPGDSSPLPLPTEAPPSVETLDASVSLPPLKINLIRVASERNPEAVAFVNMIKVYEGEFIGDTGVRALKINQDDIWCEYQGRQFRVRFR
jgi:hypothetical protein